VELIEELLDGHGIRAKQHLFIYALTQSMFNVSASMRKLGIARNTYEAWKTSDPEFAELVREIHWHKENFFESALIGRVASGDTAAIIHVAKTKLRDRGYNEKIEIEHTGSINHEHTINVIDLDLPLDVRRTILEAVRAHQATLTDVTTPMPAITVDMSRQLL
jgi:hypothetical protein